MMDIYLLMGQSNMIGRDGIREPDAAECHPRIRALNQEGEWVAAADPLPFVPPRIGVGPGMSFAETMLSACQNDETMIGLVPSAVGGTPLSRWERGGDLYESALKRASLAQESGTIRGVLWHQGERDTKSLATAQSYGERLRRIIHDFRADLDLPDLPWIAGGLIAALENRQDIVGYDTVMAALRDLPRQLDNMAFVEADGLTHIGDCTHFTAESMREFGRRYARAMIKMGLQPSH